jgi:hypothetical protein
MMEAHDAFGIDSSEIFRSIVEDHWHWRCVTRDREIGQSRLVI